jgi:hypothetical protein
VIVDASGWLTKQGLGTTAFNVEADDVHALMECGHGVHKDELDLVIHSPGRRLAEAPARALWTHPAR